MRILWPVLTRSKSPEPPDPTPALLIARLLWTEGGKQKQKQSSASQGTASQSCLSLLETENNVTITSLIHQQWGMQWRSNGEKMERQANLSIKNILKFSRFSLLHVDKIAKWQRVAARRDEMY